ncbi:MAG TPA: DUF4398 domain-containing protein [Vicinamibacterales bacterium]|nr:DUF4398 domain-containing protein [Vicinamibacterales bacterium]
MDQAQGAIDAARAAGAERYAPVEFKAATTALQQANEAVDQRDYRLALNHALESREQAQNAVRTAAETRVTLRGDVERSVAEVNALIVQVRAWIGSPASARNPRTRRAAQQAVTQAATDLQEASAAMQAEDYDGAQRVLAAVKGRIQKFVPLATAPPDVQSPKRRQ